MNIKAGLFAICFTVLIQFSMLGQGSRATDIPGGPMLSSELTVPSESPSWEEISWVELEDPYALGFDTQDYLPVNFDPYAPPYEILHLSYIDFEDLEEESVFPLEKEMQRNPAPRKSRTGVAKSR